MKLSASIPVLRDTTDSGSGKGGDLSGFVALTSVLLLGVVALAWWRKRKKLGGTPGKDGGPVGSWPSWLVGNQRSSVKLLGTTHLPGKHSLHEVEWQGKHLLIGCSSQSIHLLAEASPVNTTTNPDSVA